MLWGTLKTAPGAAALSVASNTSLVLLKLVVGLAIGSVSVISEAAHSAVDLVAAIVAFFSVRVSTKPPDEGHPFGHGKIEGMSGFIEALLLVAGVAIILHQAADKIMKEEGPSSLDLGIGAMLVSVVLNFLVSRHLYRVARQTDSLALEADAKHLSADIYTSGGVLVGLIAIRITNLPVLDPILAILVGLWILKAAYDLTRKALNTLLDTRLPASEEAQLRASLTEHLGELVGFHELRTRKSGRERHIAVHLVVPPYVTVEEAHRLCDHLEEEIKAKLPHAVVTIHIEPPESKGQ